MRYRVTWVSKTTGAKATVQWFDSLAEVEAWVSEMQRLYPDIHHSIEAELEPAEPEEPAKEGC